MVSLRCLFSSFVIILSFSGSCEASVERDPRDKPNIILFLVDDMGYGDLESYGHPSQESGPIDEMAREGMKFSRWYSPDVLCSPSRGAMLTGRLPVRVGLYGPARVFEMTTSYGLPKSEITIAEMLQEQGYYTGIVGKWHQGINEFTYNDGNHLPHHHGFGFVGHLLPFTNHWVCDETKTFVESPDRYYCLLYYNDTIIQQPLSHRNLTERLVEDAKSFIFDHQEDPFFFYFSFPQLHADMFSSPRFSGSSKRGRYGDSLNEMSWAVGEILGALKEAGLEKNTLSLFLSDHGPQMEICREGGSPGILKGSKGTNWEGGIRVSAIAHWPGTIATGSHSQAILSSLDIYATAAELSGGKLPQDHIMDSQSFMPVLKGESTEHRTTLLHYCSDRLMAVTYGTFKAHLYTQASGTMNQLATKCRPGWIPSISYHICFSCDPPCSTRHDPPLLFDIGKDPSELSPLNVMKHLDVLQEINKIIEEHHRTLVKGDSLFKKVQVSQLNPCCNPPYCFCNYERTSYLQQLGVP